jgi:methionyl-tRNA synthetase
MDLVSPRSKISGNPPVVRETSHWYFPLGKFQKRLEKYIAERNARDGWKDNVLQYCRGWFKEGLQDRAVTRDLDWGVRVPLPGYEQKVIYVWFDAVLGYISSTKEWGAREGDPDRWKRYWLEDGTKYVAFIGKDNVVFHCIVFPAMLMAWNDGGGPAYVLPENVPANEFLNFEGQKFSKSRGWGIDLQEFLDRYPADTLRYYLAVTLPEYRDTDFTWRDFQARTNNELADILGNFVNRTLAFTRRTFEGRVPPRGPTLPIDDAMLEVLENTPPAAAELFERYRFRDAVLHVMNLARAANKYFNDAEPWKTARTDRERCATTINLCLQVVRSLAVLMSPVTPFAAERIWQMLRLPGNASEQAWDTAGHPSLETNHALGTPHILFSKIEDTVIEGELKQLGVPPGEGPVQETGPVGAGPGPAKPPVSLEDFQKLDLRVAKVLACERVPKSEKLLKLQVEVGGERRQILAGIAKHYDADQLVGKSIVMLYNLQPAKLMGHESQGMLLAASDGGGSLVYITPAGEMPSGASIR